MRLSAREQLLVVAVILGMLLWGCYELEKKVEGIFTVQSKQLESLRSANKFLPMKIVSYQTLIKKREKVEERFRNSPADFSIRPYIEEVFQSKLGTKGSTLQITEQKASDLGERFIQLPHIVRFQVTEVEALVNFLKEITYGKQPLILSDIDLDRAFSGDKISVSIRVSSISPKSDGKS